MYPINTFGWTENIDNESGPQDNPCAKEIVGAMMVRKVPISENKEALSFTFASRKAINLKGKLQLPRHFVPTQSS
jgi:hypothetical protein